ncbi:hypothetical protein DYH09_15155 [bacterium CPR1]|nr:hypothetical protein [bacterium CPR1]
MHLALDFDGVFWDSVGECYVTARRAWRELVGVDPPECERAFRSGRWMVRVGADFGKLLSLAARDPQADLSGYPRSNWEALPFPQGPQFEQAFYRQREQARQHDPAGWAALQGPYEGFLRELPQLEARFGVPAIATTKDADSVRQLIAPLGLDLVVLGREFSTDKRKQIRHLAADWGVEPSAILLLDDLLDNLRPVQETGARVALAAWGYNTPEEREHARREGIPVLELGGVARALCG